MFYSGYVFILFSVQKYVSVNPTFPNYPSHFPFGNHKLFFYVCESVSVLNKKKIKFEICTLLIWVVAVVKGEGTLQI